MTAVTSLMERPSWKDSYVKKRAAEIYMPRVRDWFEGEKFDERSVIADLNDVLKPHESGYEMAKELERRHYWTVNDRIIEVLNECADDIGKAIKELTEQWVRAYQIKPEFAIGDTVRMLKGYNGLNVGIVANIRQEEAMYAIHTEEQKPSQNWIVKYEDVKRVAELFDSKDAVSAA